MIEYLHHWWAGDAGLYYDCLGLSLSQLNKVAKVGQYVTGLLALFELIAFSKVMGHFSLAAHIAIRVNRLWQRVLNLPILILRVIFALILALLRKLPWSEVWAVLSRYWPDALNQSSEEASSSYLVRTFRWLELHPVPDRVIKAANFCMLIFFSGVELFTS